MYNPLQCLAPLPNFHARAEEELYDDPWKVLVACMLLNKTTSTQVLAGVG